MEMDPPALNLIKDGLFQSLNAPSYNMAEIWQFPINGGASVGESRGGLELRSVPFGQSLGRFADNASANLDVSGDDPMVLDQRGARSGGARKKRLNMALEDESAKVVSTSTSNGMNGCDGKRLKRSGSRDENSDFRAEEGANSSKPPEPPKLDYIHVRARRGQATDSHSLAERARREKIGERMKVLQDLVPGCNKVIGKALVLDEIINYIQSLQSQVEFLSMKIEAVNSKMNPTIERFPSKDFCQQPFDTAAAAYGSQAPREYSRGSSPEWLHMQIGGGFERTT